jgi:hypothetical protein
MSTEEDRTAVVELIHRYAMICDLKEYDAVPRVFAEDAVVDFSALRAYVGDDIGATGHAAIRRFLERFTGGRPCMHYMQNHVVDLDGDRATMRNYMHNTNSSICGLYHTSARRTPDGWRLTSLRLEPRIIDPERVPVLPESARRLP